jgi:hypothetical protein
MKYKGPVLLLALCFVFPLSKAQQSSMSANAGLGPGNSFTLFITFQDPMPNVQGVACAFQLQGDPKPGQTDFVRQLSCAGAPIKIDATHYQIKVGDIPQDIAEGAYKLRFINVAVDGEAVHTYSGESLPSLDPVVVKNPKHLEFSPIKKLETKQ